MVILRIAALATQHPFTFLLSRAPHWTSGNPPHCNSQATRFNRLDSLPGCKDRQHDSGLANQSIAFLWLV